MCGFKQGNAKIPLAAVWRLGSWERGSIARDLTAQVRDEGGCGNAKVLDPRRLKGV